MWKLAAHGAPYFQQLVHSDMKIGLTWGRTLNAMISELPKSYDARNLSVYTLVGSVSGSAAFQPNILAQNLLNKFSGNLKIITAPFLCPTEQLCSEFKRMKEVADILGFKDVRTVKKRFPFTDGYITVATLARMLTPKVE
jgi:DNA-binding transcriptional regulator LsrR (DeoR family)